MYLEWYYINPERNKKIVTQIFFSTECHLRNTNSSAELLRHGPFEISRKVQVFKEDSSFKLKLKCLPTMCEFWKLFTLQLHSCSLPDLKQLRHTHVQLGI